MFASQLLRILQTVPSDAKQETSVYDYAEQDMSMKENQNGTLDHDSRSFQNGTLDPKFVDDLSRENQVGDNLVEKENNTLFTDKVLLECETTEFIVCQEINFLKDICVDEGINVNRVSVDRNKDVQSAPSFPRPLNDDSHCEAIGAINKELLLSDGLATTSLENMKDFNPEDSMQKGETNVGAMCGSKQESFVDKTLPIQEFGTRSFLRSFLDSLDGEENTAVPLQDQSLDHKDENTVDLSPNSPLQSDNSKSVKPMNSDGGTTVNSHFPEPENGDSGNDSGLSLRRYDEGELSFCGTDLITFSGQISYSGSLSVCSDGSVTSGRSFAFPILQPEWNSSPVRMSKAGKHKGWRSGLLCCRF